MDCLICFLNGETAWLVDIDMHDVYVSYGMNCIFMDDTWVKVNGAVATRTCSFYVVLFHICTTLNSYCYATVLVINYITLSTECTTLFFKASSAPRTIAWSAHHMSGCKLGWPSEKTALQVFWTIFELCFADHFNVFYSNHNRNNS